MAIEKKPPNGAHKSPHYRVIVEVAMTDKEPIDFLRKLFGGQLRKRIGYGNNKLVYSWRLGAGKATQAIRAMLPHFLVGRRIKNALACILLQNMMNTHLGTLRLSPAEIEIRDVLWEVCKKQRGAT
jgi:hypothetical protein